MHLLVEVGGIRPSDEFQALNAIRKFEARFFEDAEEDDDSQGGATIPNGADAEKVIARIQGRSPPITVTVQELTQHLRELIVQATTLLDQQLAERCPVKYQERLSSLDAKSEMLLFNMFAFDVIVSKAFGEAALPVRDHLLDVMEQAFQLLTEGRANRAMARQPQRFIHYTSVWKRTGGDAGLSAVGEAVAGNVFNFASNEAARPFALNAGAACAFHLQFLLASVGELNKAYRLWGSGNR
jgi:hypothetical protein